ncbi:hypothetical protein [Bradyrhizobium sp. 192]|uniref:hypothetical protein n=1 Tax=Bradyrhizobium sp. 192 TaxID=2782660 RepID=UPI0020002784|nr:hypothetical protein [Bradyrhizobium sp. 192]UPJ58683.1 hypothetical protein IVB24_02260 [Bradyrhizobium sp. 192]
MNDAVRHALIDFVASFEKFAEEAASGVGIGDDFLKLCVDQFRGTAPDTERSPVPGEPNCGAVHNLIAVVDDYERLSLWLVEVLDFVRDLSRNDQNNFPDLPALGPFLPNAYVDLSSALSAAITIGGYAPKDPVFAAQLRKLTQAARNCRHPGSDEINARLVELIQLGTEVKQIPAILGISKDAVRKRLKRLGLPQKRSRKSRATNRTSG